MSLESSKDLLYRWRRELTAQKEIAFPRREKEALTEEKREIKELQKRLQDAEMERNILKKSLAIFSRASK